jgi:hypothetical protein
MWVAFAQMDAQTGFMEKNVILVSISCVDDYILKHPLILWVSNDIHSVISVKTVEHVIIFIQETFVSVQHYDN